ncbi:hypothetical protein A33M_3336 [Rhodovulum sp. PH10]|uniref:hypothetical protein n=1 Tax=Rhodovulum sp. PH10 TaxID=1187851 RepID=UPI00027C292E|nr:hypothetical protein [Rhodovulum sp. PH10]EJW11258.1 hypothetical protein A33M_3336 [Rhodovulum sp. PH10]
MHMGDVITGRFPRVFGRGPLPLPSAIAGEVATEPAGPRDQVARIVVEETGCNETRADFVALRVLQMLERV